MRDLAALSFYFPRRLGRPVSQARDTAPKRADDPKPSGSPTYETWREGLSRAEVAYEPIDEASLRRRLLTEQGAGAGIVLVTGEPGAGKSRLLEELIVDWARSTPPCYLGARVPVVVRCRDLASADLGLRDQELADRLWERRAAAPPGAMANACAVHERSTWRVWEPLWLIDGLDELPDGLFDDALCRRLAALPGRVCASCRTAVAQARKGALQGSGAVSLHVELLALDPAEQRAFLVEFFYGDEPRSAALHGRVQGNAQLRELAGSPLLLALIAEVGEERLPAGRAGFYASAVAELWERRVKGADRDRLRPHREALLTALAGSMRLDSVVAPMEMLDRCRARLPLKSPDGLALVEALRATGVLRLETEKVEFLHLTFQEFFLARHLAGQPFAEVLGELWVDPRYEETLALRVALALEKGAAGDVDQTLLSFLDRSLERHRLDPEPLRREGRSPLRFLLHLLQRAGVREESLPRTSERLVQLLEAAGPRLLRIAVAYDQRSPAAVLERLADGRHKDVRRGVASNAAAPAAVLERLARDPDTNVRLRVADNPAVSVAVLERLAGDRDKYVREGVASNAATPAAALEQLARDPDSDVRRKADYSYTAARAAVLGRRANPPDVECLAGDPDPFMRGLLASSTAASAAVLERLAGDSNEMVRRGVASNAAAPAAVLERLVGDSNEEVREGVASNAAAPATVLERLAGDPDEEVREGVAGNPTTSAAVLERLAGDPDEDVREGVASNPAAPAAALERLAGDRDKYVREGVARNRATPAAVLERLAGDPDEEVREGVAGNPTTSAAVLERLAGDHLAATVNPRILLEDLL